MNVAQLTIEMAANVARLKTDMAAARNTVEGTMNSIKKAAGAAQVALGAIGVGLSTAAFANWIKGAINAADEANKLSQKIGITVKEIGGLQLAFQQGGVDAASMQTALAKLNKNIAAGDTAFKTLGVSTKNTDGSLRSTSMVLADVADRFAGTQDGAAKTAMAIDLFGKSGAALIPVLNAGGSSIREFQALAEQLGLTLSSETAAAAEKFNDTLELIGMGSRGIANQVMAELLPTLQTLAGEFLNLMTQGGNLKGIADVISAGLKGLFTVAAIGIEIFRTLGNTIGATAAGIVAFASGDFKGAATIIGELGKDIRTNWTATLQSIDNLWNQSGNTAIEAAAKITRGSMQSTAAMDEAAKAASKLAEEQKKARQAADELVASIAFETETMQMSNLEREIANNLLKLEKTGLQENTDEYRAYAEAIRLATIENEGIKQRIKLEKEAADKRKKIEEDFAREVEQINFQIGQSLTDALINGGQTAKEFLINMFKTLILRPILQPIITSGTAMVMSALGMTASGSASANSGSLSSVSNLGSLASMASSVNNAYTALTSATLGALDSIAAGAQAATFAVGEGLASMGFESAGAAVFNSAGTVGLAAQGAAGIGAGTLAGEWISNGKSLIGGNSLYTTGGGAAAGAAIGTAIVPGVGTFVGGLIGGLVGGLANAAFGSGAKNFTSTNMSGTWTPNGLVGGQQFANWEKKGGWFSGGSSGRDHSGMNRELETYMSNAVISVANAAKGYADILGLNAESISNITHYFEIPANSVEEVTKYLEIELKGYSDQLASALLAGTSFGRTGESASQTLSRLATSLTTVNTTFDTLGLKLQETSLAGANVASAFIDMMGGIEAFNQATDFYYQNFYTQAERTAKATENLTAVFAAMNVSMPTTREQFKALVDTTAAAGDQVLLANLLKLAPAFNSIATAAEQANQAIMQQRSQLVGQINQMIGNTQGVRDAEISQIDETNRQLQLSIYAMQDAAAAQSAANQAVANATANLQAAVDQEISKIEKTIEGKLQASLDSLNAQFETLSATINEQISSLQVQKSVLSETLSNIKSIFDFLGGQIQDIMGFLRPVQIAREGMAFINQALEIARRTGYLPDSNQLQSAVSAARGGLGSESFTSSLEMRKANIQFANSLIELQGIAEGQKDTTETQIEKTDEQIELLRRRLEQAKQYYEADVANSRAFYDAQLNTQKQQLNALLGINNATLSVSSALVALANAMDSAAAANAAATAAQQAAAAAATAATATSAPKLTPFQELVSTAYKDILRRPYDVAGLDFWSASGLSITKIRESMMASPEYRNLQINDLYKMILGRDADASGLSYYGSSPLTISQIESDIKKSPEAKLKGWATGGFYPGGMALVGEEGPELINFKKPGQVYTANETRSIMNDGGTAEELRQLRVENQAQSRAIVMLQSRMTRLLERWDGDGLPEERVVTA